MEQRTSDKARVSSRWLYVSDGLVGRPAWQPALHSEVAESQ